MRTKVLSLSLLTITAALAAAQDWPMWGRTPSRNMEGPAKNLPTDINTGVQTQNVTAFNGAGNANGGNFTVVAEQNVGDTEVPSYDDMGM